MVDKKEIKISDEEIIVVYPISEEEIIFRRKIFDENFGEFVIATEPIYLTKKECEVLLNEMENFRGD